MHEVGLMQEALDIVEDHARRGGAKRVLSIRLRVGDDSGVMPDSLRLAFDALVPETIAGQARLDIEAGPVVCYCPRCNDEFAPDDIFYECPWCGTRTSDVRAGREFQVVSVEVE